MKKYFNLLKSAPIIILLLTSCNDDFLERYPLDKEGSANFYQTEENAIMALVSVYDVLGHDETSVSWAPFVTISDILSDDAFAGGGDSNDGAEEDQMNTYDIATTNPLVHAIWIRNYTGIFRANLLMEKIDGVDASDEFKAQVVAECKFLRAYFYLELVRFFENIPLLTETIKGPSQYPQPQAPVADVYNQIALDLVEAVAVLPESYSAAEAGRVTKWAAQALLARTYLFYNGVYGAELDADGTVVDKAFVLAYLEDLIANSGHDLFPEYETNFKLAGEFGIESVFEISHGDTPAWWDWNYVRGGEGNLAAQMQGPRVEGGSVLYDRGWSFAPVSQKLVDDLQGDPRLEFTVLFEDDIRADEPGVTLNYGYQHTGYFSKKYTSDAEHWGSGGQFELNRTSNIRVIRFSDVLLMAAELGSPNAQTYLDRVRDRVGLASVPATPENIYAERRLELSLEGIRYFDVLRKGLDYASQEFTVVGLNGPNYDGDQTLYDHTFNPNTKGFLPIPLTEIDLSKGTEHEFQQNDGY
ncbi:MAG: RagB/SusD family nutrient uptake outer membrane protein [Salinivirgaceae bacterium]